MRFSAPDEAIWVGCMRLVLSVPGSRSLKDKRRIVHQVRDRLRAGRNLTVAEVGHLDHHSRSVVAVAMLGNDARFLRSALDTALGQIQSWQGFLVEEAEIEVVAAMSAEGPGEYDGGHG